MSLAASDAFADGCFVWHKGADLNEPSQKAVLCWKDGLETLLLQVKYEGAAEDFAWIVPLPAKPDIAAIQPAKSPFAELSLYTQERRRWGYRDVDQAPGPAAVTVLERKIVGVYDVAVLAAEDAAALAGWLSRNGYAFPAGRREVLEHYTKKKWVYVAMRIDRKALQADEVKKLRSGELQPIRFAFATDTMVYPLRISSVNAGRTELLLYLLADVPMVAEAKHDSGRFPIEENMPPLRHKESDVKYGTYRKAFGKELPFTWESLGLGKEAALSLCKYRAIYDAREMTGDLVFVPFQPEPYWEARLDQAEHREVQLAILEFLAGANQEKYQKRLSAMLDAMAKSPDASVRRLAAADRATPVELLRRLSGDTDASVRWDVAINPRTPVEALERLSRDPDSSVRYALATYSAATPDILRKLVADGSLEVVQAAAHNSRLPLDTLRELARSESVDVRRVVASCPRCPPDCLAKLAADSDIAVRAHTASNPSTPPRFLALLARDRELAVRDHLAASQTAPADMLRFLADDIEGMIRDRVASNPNTPATAFAVLAKDKLPHIRERVAQSSKTPGEVLALMADDEDGNVRDGVAGNPHTPTATLIRMAAGPPGPLADVARRNLEVRGAVKGEQATAEAPKPVRAGQGDGKPLERLSPKLRVRYAHGRLNVNLAGPSEGLAVTWPLPKDVRGPLRESIDPTKRFPEVLLYRGNDMEKYLAPSGAAPRPRPHETAVAGVLECEPGTKDKTVKMTLRDLRFQTVAIPQIGPFDVELDNPPAP